MSWFHNRNNFSLLVVFTFVRVESLTTHFDWQQIFYSLFANFTTKIFNLRIFKNLYQYLLHSYLRKFWMFLSKLSQCAQNYLLFRNLLLQLLNKIYIVPHWVRQLPKFHVVSFGNLILNLFRLSYQFARFPRIITADFIL